jgi:hypothetical protein
MDQRSHSAFGSLRVQKNLLGTSSKTRSTDRALFIGSRVVRVCRSFFNRTLTGAHMLIFQRTSVVHISYGTYWILSIIGALVIGLLITALSTG